VNVESLGHIDVVLLSHDHHFDNLDRTGRTFLEKAPKIITKQAGAERLGNNAIGLASWQSIELPTPKGDILRITGTPARHGPARGNRGPVTGFVLTSTESLPGPYTFRVTRSGMKASLSQSTLRYSDCHFVHGGGP